MGWFTKAAKSSVGAKFIMALTGVILVGFVFGHMSGNLLVFAGQQAYNDYAAMLKGMGGILWAVRGALLAAVLLHILSGMRLAAINRAARPVAYAKKRHLEAKLSGRTMALSGLLLFAFIVYHLLHFTVGVTHPEHFALRDSLGRHDVYSMFVRGFQDPAVSASYMVAVVLLGMHLSHGISSMFQSLGLNTPKYEPVIKALGPALSIIVVLGNFSMPIAVMAGYIAMPGVNG